ncbi:MAG: GspH/FimT family protein [Phycisphaerales bacterium]|nr:GspH/FimT family protein [Phycisphaerales bacterium]
MPLTGTNLGRSGLRVGGFTLMELLAVLVLLAIISAVVVPTLSNVGATRQAAAASRLLRDVQLARQRAVARGVRTWVVIDADAQQYALFIEDAAAPGRANRQPIIDEATGKPFVVALNQGEWRGASVAAVDIAGRSEVGFDSRGRPLGADEALLASDGTITLSGGHTVRITARTGLVQRIQ